MSSCSKGPDAESSFAEDVVRLHAPVLVARAHHRHPQWRRRHGGSRTVCDSHFGTPTQPRRFRTSKMAASQHQSLVSKTVAVVLAALVGGIDLYLYLKGNLVMRKCSNVIMMRKCPLYRSDNTMIFHGADYLKTFQYFLLGQQSKYPTQVKRTFPSHTNVLVWQWQKTLILTWVEKTTLSCNVEVS